LPTFAMTPATCCATKAALRRFSNSKDENGEPWSDVAMSSNSSTQLVENGGSVYIYIYMQNNWNMMKYVSFRCIYMDNKYRYIHFVQRFSVYIIQP
jgi:hypothetical protein